MIELLVVLGAAGLAYWFVLRSQKGSGASVPLAAPRISPQLVQLTAYANRLYAEKKWLGAEKAYLNILKLNHKDVGAYSHLGIIYSTQKNLADAIECFDIAARLRPSAVTFQNLALAYLDNRNYVKAAATFEKSIMFEATSARYIGLSKAKKALHDTSGTIRALELAVKLDPNRRILEFLEQAYVEGKRRDDARKIRDRLVLLADQNPKTDIITSDDAAATATRPHSA